MAGSWRVLISAAVIVPFSVALSAQAPTARGPIIEIADSNSATVVWSTEQPSAGRVWYGDDPGDLTQIAEDNSRGTEHRVRLEGLQANSTYFFQIDSSPSGAPEEAQSPAVMSFRTIAPGQQPIRNAKAVFAQRGISSNETGDLHR